MDELQSSVYCDFVSTTVMSLIIDTSDEDSDDEEKHNDRLWFQATVYSSLENTHYLFHDTHYLFRDQIYRADISRVATRDRDVRSGPGRSRSNARRPGFFVCPKKIA